MLMSKEISYSSIRSLCRLSMADSANELLKLITVIPQRDMMIKDMGLLEISVSKLRGFLDNDEKRADDNLVDNMIRFCVCNEFILSKSSIEDFACMEKEELKSYINNIYHGIVLILLLERFNTKIGGREVLKELLSRLDVAMFTSTGTNAYEACDMMNKVIIDFHNNIGDFRRDSFPILSNSIAIMESVLLFVFTYTFDALFDTCQGTPLKIYHENQYISMLPIHDADDEDSLPFEIEYLYSQYGENELAQCARLILDESDVDILKRHLTTDDMLGRLEYSFGILVDLYSIEDLQENSEKLKQLYEVGDEFFNEYLMDCLVHALRILKNRKTT